MLLASWPRVWQNGRRSATKELRQLRQSHGPGGVNRDGKAGPRLVPWIGRPGGWPSSGCTTSGGSAPGGAVQPEQVEDFVRFIGSRWQATEWQQAQARQALEDWLQRQAGEEEAPIRDQKSEAGSTGAPGPRWAIKVSVLTFYIYALHTPDWTHLTGCPFPLVGRSTHTSHRLSSQPHLHPVPFRTGLASARRRV